MKCLLTLEWNSKWFNVLAGKYTALASRDEDRQFSDGTLPSTAEAARLLVVDIASQSMAVVAFGSLQTVFSVSTASNGAGCREGSGCTPLGWHRIEKKIGADAPIGTVFKGRRAIAVADCLSSALDDDLITSRILWLSGLQPGINAGGKLDSFARYIYLHGTAQEQLLGRAVSHGCIRMGNDDILTLFDQVDRKTVVLVCHNVVEFLAH